MAAGGAGDRRSRAEPPGRRSRQAATQDPTPGRTSRQARRAEPGKGGARRKPAASGDRQAAKDGRPPRGGPPLWGPSAARRQGTAPQRGGRKGAGRPRRSQPPQAGAEQRAPGAETPGKAPTARLPLMPRHLCRGNGRRSAPRGGPPPPMKRPGVGSRRRRGRSGARQFNSLETVGNSSGGLTPLAWGLT